MRNRRALICAALALAVPLPAYALASGGEEAGPAALSVGASLSSCGIAQTQVVCVIDVSFDPIPDAHRYRASVTRADGSVIDYGSIVAGGASLPVTYVGAGTYAVRVSAYGHKDSKPLLLDTDVSSAEPADGDRRGGGRGAPGPRDTGAYGGGDAEAGGEGEGDAALDSDDSADVGQDCVAALASAPPATGPSETPAAEMPDEEHEVAPSDGDEPVDENGHRGGDADDDADEARETVEAPAAPAAEAPTAVTPPAAAPDCPAP
ncbi:MAG: hypothetical protein ACRDK9_05830 [Solirubrobacterales bacterium]